MGNESPDPKPEGIDKNRNQIFRQLKISLGLGAAVLTLGCAMVIYRAEASKAEPKISNIQRGTPQQAEKVLEVYLDN